MMSVTDLKGGGSVRVEIANKCLCSNRSYISSAGCESESADESLLLLTNLRLKMLGIFNSREN